MWICWFLQIAAIASTPLPSFSLGGIVPESNEHLYPNMPKSKHANDKTLAWLSEGELVLNIDQQREMKQQMEFLQAMRSVNTDNSNNSSNIKNITNEINIYAKEGMNTKQLTKQVVLEISRGYS